MRCLRLPTVLFIITGVACWTDPFNWHFLPKHYRLYSNLTVEHTVQFDTDCGTLAADSGATHFLWVPAGGLCSVSSGLTAVDFSGSSQQDTKTRFYYVRDFALVVPPGSPNCPTEAQLKRMIDNLKAMNGSFTVEADPTRRTWRSECKKNESADATPATPTASTVSLTKTATTSANVSSATAAGMSADHTSARDPSSTVNNGLAESDSSSASPATTTHATTLSGKTLAVPPTSAATAPWPMTDTLGPVEDAIVTQSRFASVTSAKTTAFEETETTMEETSVTSTSSHTPPDVTPTDSMAAVATASRSTTVTPSPVSSNPARNPSIYFTRSKTASFVSSSTLNVRSIAADTTMGEDSTKTTATSPAAPVPVSASSDTTVDETMSTSVTSKMRTDGISSSSPAVRFTQQVTTTLETTTTSGLIPTSAPTAPCTVKTTVVSSTTSVQKQGSATTAADTTATDTTMSTIPPSSATATTMRSMKPTLPNGKPSTVSGTTSRTVKTSSTSKLTNKRTTPKPTTAKRTTPKPATPKLNPMTCKTSTVHAVPFYYAYSAKYHDYIYTSNLSEAQTTPGYTKEGIAGRILRTPALGSTKLFRLYHPGNQSHFYTAFPKGKTDALNQGAKDEGIAGYVYQTAADKRSCPCEEVRPLYRFLKYAPTAKYFYTMDPKEKARAINVRFYTEDGVAACMYPS